MMKEGNFDAYVQAQFADEAVVPPSHVETAVFNELAAGARRTKLRRLGLGVLTVGICSAGFYLNQDSGSIAIPVEEQPVQVQDLQEMQEVEVAALDEQTTWDGPEIVVSTAQTEFVQEEEILDPLFETQPPLRMEEAGIKPMNALDRGPSIQTPALQIETSETWVMPANVTVKE